MGTPVSVLILEDSEDDSLLVVRRMRKGGYDPDWLRVGTAEAMTAALHKGIGDLALSDYKLPNFDGLTALELFKDSGLDIPFTKKERGAPPQKQPEVSPSRKRCLRSP